MSDQDDTSLPPLQDDNAQQSVDDTQAPADLSFDPVTDNQRSFSKSHTDIPEEAADIDLIEKQWVVKAKEIVEHTSEDPHLQQQEIAKMKAEYIKKRYKRDIQL